MKKGYACFLGLSVVCILALSSVTVSAQNSKIRSDLSRSFKKFDLVRPDGARDEGSMRSLRLRAAGRDHQLVLSQNDMFAANYKAEDTGSFGTREIERPAVNTYKGRVTGDDRSEVRLTIDESGIEGFFDVGGERYFVEPARRYSDAASVDQTVIYKEEDSLNTETFYCAADLPGRIAVGESLLNQNTAQAILASRNLEIATEADLQYVTILGGAAQANANITSILNMVEGTYTSELDLEITITFQHTWSTADPFAGANSGDILMNFLNYWDTNYPRSSYPRDTAHMFSGKSNILSAGIAFVGAVCYTPQYAYGVSGYVSWAPGKFLIPAHEIGHNLGAEHAETAQGCGNTIMNAFLGSAAVLSFCPYSRNEIGAFMTQNGSCLGGTSPTPTPTPTPMPTATPTPTPTPVPTPTPTPVPTPTPIPTPTPNPNVRTRFDFDGDRRADLVVFRPSNGTWYMNRTSTGFYVQQFGQNGDKDVAADYDGDGKTDIAVYRSGTWYRTRSSTLTYDTATFGIPGDIPAPADFDGDNKADLAVFRPSTGQWFWIGSSNGNFSIVNFGVNGDVPMAGDYDGDGRADIAVFRPSNGTWYRLNSGGGFVVQQFGASGDKAVSGDFDGDGKFDLAVWRPSNGNWYVIGGGSNTYSITTFGVPGDIPAPADFDGDGKADISVFRPSNGSWYRLNSSNKAFVIIQYGQNGDAPAPSYYVQ